MMITMAAVVRELVAAGVTGDALVTAIERIEAASAPKRSAGAERTARWRERHKASQSVTSVTSDDATDANKGFDKERFHTSKEITSKQIPDTGPRDEDFDLVKDVCAVVSCIQGPLPDDATACHDAVELALRADGLAVVREQQVRNGDGIRGRFDLVVSRGQARVAIEIDRRQSRAKSVQKLLGFDGGRIQILRGSEPPHKIEGIHACLSLPVAVMKRNSGPLPDDYWPSDQVQTLARKLGFNTDQIQDQIERMRDWAKNADGKKSRKKDWNAAFRNWIKRVADDKQRKSSPYGNRASPAQAMRDAFDEIDAHIAERRTSAGQR